MTRQKGWYIKQSFDNDFVNLLSFLYDKYGEEVFSIQGIANKHMDLVNFSKNFFNKSTNVAAVSVDDNANVREKNLCQYNYENNKALMKLNGYFLIYKYMKKLYSKEEAAEAVEKLLSGELFLNDFSHVSSPYCYAFDLRKLLMDGMDFFKANMRIKPPKRSESFIALVIQSTAYISNQIAGACSYPDFFVILNKFYEKEHGKDYMDRIRNTHDVRTNVTRKRILNQFQNLIYSLNFPFRGNQSSFTNLSVMDIGFLEGLLEGYVYPDGTKPNYKNICELSKLFFEYYTDINSDEGIFTFPVMTLAISLDDNGEYIDEDFVKWTAEVNSDKSLGNVFQSVPNSFSSCCRLRNEFKSSGDSGYHNSFGVGGLSIGSLRVCGLNLPRMAYLEKDNPNILNENLEVVHKILKAHRFLINKRIKEGFMPLYSSDWIHTEKQYSTVGIIGCYEYLENKNLNIKNKNHRKVLIKLLKTIDSTINKWQKEENNIYNIEQIPGESMAVRLAEIDKLIGMNNKYELYSNQYLPLIDDSNIYDRFKIQGELDNLTSGGAILHLNIDDEKPLSPEQYMRLIKTAKDTGTIYFAVNYAFSECKEGHFSVGKHLTCPVCEGKIIEQYTRVVGFLVPVSAWNPVRKNFEYPNRHFYRND